MTNIRHDRYARLCRSPGSIPSSLMLLFWLMSFLNLAIGFATAIWVKRSLARSLSPIDLADESDDATSENTIEKVLNEAAVEQEEVAGADCIPEPWTKILFEEAVAPNTMLEGAIHVLRIQSMRHFSVDIENNLQFLQQIHDDQMMELSENPRQLAEAIQSWSSFSKSVQASLAEKKDKFGRGSSIYTNLDKTLESHRSELDEHAEVANKVNFGRDLEEERTSMTDLYRRHFDSVVAFREFLDDSFAELMIACDSLDGLEQTMKTDGDTGLLNRCGLEHSFKEYHSQSSGPLSLIAIAIDDFIELSFFNECYLGDRIIQAVAKVLDENIRKGRGFDRLSRVGRGQFVLLLGDTESHLAVHPAERLRKVVEASSFQCGRAAIKMTISAAVWEAKPSQSLADAIRRLNDGLNESQEENGNQTRAWQAGQICRRCPFRIARTRDAGRN